MVERANSLHPDHQRTVLLADADPTVRSALSLLLGRERTLRVVGEAADLQDLLTRASATRPDLVLVDWDLPGLQPDGALEALRSRCPWVVVIALSVRPDRRLEILAAGAQAFVSKAEGPSRLLAALRSVAAPAAGPQGDSRPTAPSVD